MKREYKKYIRHQLEKEYSKLKPKEKKVLDDFISVCSVNAGDRKILDIKRSVMQFRDICEKPLYNMDIKSVREFMTLLNKSDREKHTKNGIKAHVQRFLKHQYSDWNIRFENFRDIKMHRDPKNHQKINADTLPTKKEIELMMIGEEILFWKTFLITLYESGCRPFEIRQLKWDDIDLNYKREISKIKIYSSKTDKTRMVYVKEATHYLSKLKEQNKADYVFVSPHKSKSKEPYIGKSIVSTWFRDLGRRTIGRDVFPYLLRHKRARELYTEKGTKVDDHIASKFLGHSKSMKEIYDNLSPEDVMEAMEGIVYKTEDLPEEKKHELENKIESLEAYNKLREDRDKEEDKNKEVWMDIIGELMDNPSREVSDKLRNTFNKTLKKRITLPS